MVGAFSKTQLTLLYPLAASFLDSVNSELVVGAQKGAQAPTGEYQVGCILFCN